jgi:hypothetical protein
LHAGVAAAQPLAQTPPRTPEPGPWQGLSPELSAWLQPG